jgi:hypothetical protein
MRSALARMFASKKPRSADRVTAVLRNWISVASTSSRNTSCSRNRRELNSTPNFSPRHRGALFGAIEGDHATILGLPILPLLKFLREEGSLIS